MAIQFTCPHCGAPQDADERYAGLTGPCTACGQKIAVPGGAAPSEGITPGKAAAGMGLAGVLMIVGVVSLVVLLGCGGVLVALLLPAVQAARTAARRTASMNNEKQIMLALHNYHDTYREFPPAVTVDADGKPMHSWRVLILPFVEEAALHSQYDFTKPWDSPENMALAERMPKVYRSPFATEGGETSKHTNYFLVTGKGTLFEDPQQKINLAQITDGTSNTIALVESHNNGVVWTQPNDLDAGQLDFMIRSLQEAQPNQINSPIPGGTVVGMFDGSVRFLSDQTPPQEFQSAVTPDDNRAPNLGF